MLAAACSALPDQSIDNGISAGVEKISTRMDGASDLDGAVILGTLAFGVARWVL